MKTISKSRLKAQILGVIRELEQSGGELLVTDHGRPTLKISVMEAPKKRVRELFADVAGKIVYNEDIMAPTSLLLV